MDWARVASVGEIKAGELKGILVDGQEVLLANLDGEIRATSDVCSHEFVLLHDGWLEEDEVECPQHGSKFDLRSGNVRGLPATEPISLYEVKVEGEDIFVRGPKEKVTNE